MPEARHHPFIDASVFLGMHHVDETIRRRSLALFHCYYERSAHMNFEQIGICDAMVWTRPRAVQDSYYPFMDVLHTNMSILRAGYEEAHLELAARSPQLHGLRMHQRLQAAQVLCTGATLFTHDSDLLDLDCLQPYLGSFDNLAEAGLFPPDLQTLYVASLSFSVSGQEWCHV